VVRSHEIETGEYEVEWDPDGSVQGADDTGGEAHFCDLARANMTMMASNPNRWHLI
jgi:hypothetical protein